MEQELKAVIRLLVENRWPFRLHATYDESITRFLDVFRRSQPRNSFRRSALVLRPLPRRSPTATSNASRRSAAASRSKHRMAFQGEYFIDRYGAKPRSARRRSSKCCESGIPVGAGTDATRVASYNPWVSLYWMVTGKTVGGAALYPEANRLDRLEALRLYTLGSTWFSSEEGKKGSIVPGQLADLAVLSADYFSIPEEQIKGIESVLTIVGGKVVYAAGTFADSRRRSCRCPRIGRRSKLTAAICLSHNQQGAVMP